LPVVRQPQLHRFSLQAVNLKILYREWPWATRLNQQRLSCVRSILYSLPNWVAHSNEYFSVTLPVYATVPKHSFQEPNHTRTCYFTCGYIRLTGMLHQHAVNFNHTNMVDNLKNGQSEIFRKRSGSLLR
jgi:hypothetical protein